MHFRNILGLAAAFAAPLWMGWSDPLYAEIRRVSGPVVHANLALFFIHGPSAAGKVPLTLEEALARDVVKVHETGDVNTLTVENLGSEDVFIQSGDLVKGGKQDRVLTVSMVLPPQSGQVPIGAFCVEEGRWSARGSENVRYFASSAAQLYSRAAKLAIKSPHLLEADPARPMADPRNDTAVRQLQMWRAVRAAQEALSRNVGTGVAAPQSRTSMQLAYENEKLQMAREAYVKALQAAGESDDIVGYVYAVNGKINSADVYPSNGLFRKMWPKLLAAAATEAIGEKTAGTSAPPTLAAVHSFLDAAERGSASEKSLPLNGRLQMRVADEALYFETKQPTGGWVHKNYLVR